MKERGLLTRPTTPTLRHSKIPAVHIIGKDFLTGDRGQPDASHNRMSIRQLTEGLSARAPSPCFLPIILHNIRNGDESPEKNKG